MVGPGLCPGVQRWGSMSKGEAETKPGGLELYSHCLFHGCLKSRPQGQRQQGCLQRQESEVRVKWSEAVRVVVNFNVIGTSGVALSGNRVISHCR